jgi:hypothetical protein
MDTKQTLRKKKYASKPIDKFSAITPWLILPFGFRTSKAAFGLITTVLKDFFFLQHLQRLHITHRSVIFVDTKLDDDIPFIPEKVTTYLSFVKFFIQPMSMLIKRLGYKKAAPYLNSFISTLSTMYSNAASIYRFCMTTTHRPKKCANRRFRMIYITDPHLLCVPSLHVTLAAGTYIWFKNLFAQNIFQEEEQQFRINELYQKAIAITESVLFVKQHSVNCIPIALYMLSSSFGPAFFTIEEAVHFMSDLYKNSPEIPESKKKEITEYFQFMYETTLLENNYNDRWQDCIKKWLVNFAKSTGQTIKMN